MYFDKGRSLLAADFLALYGDALHFLNQEVFQEQSGNVSEVYIAEDASDDPFQLLSNHCLLYLMRGDHHIVQKVSLDVGLERRRMCLLSKEGLHHLHNLIIRPFPTKVRPPLLMLGL